MAWLALRGNQKNYGTKIKFLVHLLQAILLLFASLLLSKIGAMNVDRHLSMRSIFILINPRTIYLVGGLVPMELAHVVGSVGKLP